MLKNKRCYIYEYSIIFKLYVGRKFIHKNEYVASGLQYQLLKFKKSNSIVQLMFRRTLDVKKTV